MWHRVASFKPKQIPTLFALLKLAAALIQSGLFFLPTLSAPTTRLRLPRFLCRNCFSFLLSLTTSVKRNSQTRNNGTSLFFTSFNALLFLIYLYLRFFRTSKNSTILKSPTKVKQKKKCSNLKIEYDMYLQNFCQNGSFTFLHLLKENLKKIWKIHIFIHKSRIIMKKK